jgi:hypothetical protein
MTDLVFLFGAADGEDADETTEDAPEVSGATRTLSADEIDAMVARAASRGSRKASKELATELGFDSAGALKEWVAGQQQAAEAQKTEEQKVLEQARRASQEAEESKRVLARQRLDLSIERAVLRAGVADEKKSSRIATLVKADIDNEIDLSDEAVWQEAITVALESVKSDAPELFNHRTGFGSGDGGATGGSATDDQEQLKATQEEEWDKEFARKGWL